MRERLYAEGISAHTAVDGKSNFRDKGKEKAAFQDKLWVIAYFHPYIHVLAFQKGSFECWYRNHTEKSVFARPHE